MSATPAQIRDRNATDYRCDEPGCSRALLLPGKDNHALRRIATATGWHVCDECVLCPTHAPKPLPPLPTYPLTKETTL